MYTGIYFLHRDDRSEAETFIKALLVSEIFFFNKKKKKKHHLTALNNLLLRVILV